MVPYLLLMDSDCVYYFHKKGRGVFKKINVAGIRFQMLLLSSLIIIIACG